MNNADVIQQYFDAWNNHDSKAVVSTFAPTGNYRDPLSNEKILTATGIQIAADELIKGMPDVKFEIVSRSPIFNDTVAIQWIMSGTNTGPYKGFPATNSSFSVPGADFIGIKNNQIISISGYYDLKSLYEQLLFISPSERLIRWLMKPVSILENKLLGVR